MGDKARGFIQQDIGGENPMAWANYGKDLAKGNQREIYPI
jgi:hypothetical protein